MRKTAHISLLVEFDDSNRADLSELVGLLIAGINLTQEWTVIGTPRAVEHKRPICSVSHDEFMTTLHRMDELGGGFVQHLSETLAVADSANRQRLLDEFWNTFCNHWREA